MAQTIVSPPIEPAGRPTEDLVIWELRNGNYAMMGANRTKEVLPVLSKVSPKDAANTEGRVFIEVLRDAISELPAVAPSWIQNLKEVCKPAGHRAKNFGAWEIGRGDFLMMAANRTKELLPLLSIPKIVSTNEVVSTDATGVEGRVIIEVPRVLMAKMQETLPADERCKPYRPAWLKKILPDESCPNPW